MEFRHLVTFQRVARLLSFTRAAEELRFAQSSVTSQIRALETALGVELFHRLGGRIRLTESGEQLLEYADRILALVGEAKAEVTGSDGPSGKIVIGTMESITSYRLPPLLELIHHRYPAVQLSLRPSLCSETCHALRQGEFELGFLMDQETSHPGLETLVLMEEDLKLVAAPDHPLTREATLTLDDLRQATKLATETGCSYRDLFERELKEAGPTSFLEFGTIESIKRGVMAGLGIALLPAVAVEAELERGAMVVLPWQPPFTVYTQLAWRRGKRLSREVRLFIEQTMRLVQEDSPVEAGTGQR